MAGAAEPRPGYHEKDKVENYLHAQVCSGAVPLQEAQQEIATDWLAVYQGMPGAGAPVSAPTTRPAPAPTPTAAPAAAPTAPPAAAPPASTDASYPCQAGQIKANRNSGIYHVPGGASYSQTRANVQCFDTEAEAQAAGFRRAQR